MVAIAQMLVAILMWFAGLLGALAERVPEGVPTTVPAACVEIPILAQGQLQAGYCP